MNETNTSGGGQDDGPAVPEGREPASVNQQPTDAELLELMHKSMRDVTRENGRIKLSRTVWVFRWTECGFGAVIDDPSQADIRKHADIDIPAGAEIFSVPVADDWGLK